MCETGFGPEWNSARYFIKVSASESRALRLLELSNWSPRWTTFVATSVIRSSNAWKSSKASYKTIIWTSQTYISEAEEGEKVGGAHDMET